MADILQMERVVQRIISEERARRETIEGIGAAVASFLAERRDARRRLSRELAQRLRIGRQRLAEEVMALLRRLAEEREAVRRIRLSLPRR